MIVKLLVNALAVMVTAYLLPGVKLDGYFAAVVVSIVLGILNSVVKPLLHLFALPITILTLGLFSIVINAFVIMLADWMVRGFQVDGFWWALAFSFVLALVNWFMNSLSKEYKKMQPDDGLEIFSESD
jgi:putative membrane protein